jgi:glutamate receptor, ionotropic, invertebrate
MQELLQKYDNKDFSVMARQLDIAGDGNYRPQMKHVKSAGSKCIIFACSIEILEEVLKQAQQVGLLSDEHQIIVASLDMHTLDLEPFQHSGSQITGVRIVSPDDPYVKTASNFFIEMHKKENEDKDDLNDDNEQISNSNDDDDDENNLDEKDTPEFLLPHKLRLDAALTFDAVLLFSEVAKIDENFQPSAIDCDDDTQVRVHGISDIMAMKTKRSIKGLTGKIHFDQKGFRSEFIVEILDLASDGIKRIGVWNSTDSVIYKDENANTVLAWNDELSLKNQTFIVLTAIVSY